jgi:hypothetical protein
VHAAPACLQPKQYTYTFHVHLLACSFLNASHDTGQLIFPGYLESEVTFLLCFLGYAYPGMPTGPWTGNHKFFIHSSDKPWSFLVF